MKLEQNHRGVNITIEPAEFCLLLKHFVDCMTSKLSLERKMVTPAFQCEITVSNPGRRLTISGKGGTEYSPTIFFLWGNTAERKHRQREVDLVKTLVKVLPQEISKKQLYTLAEMSRNLWGDLKHAFDEAVKNKYFKEDK